MNTAPLEAEPATGWDNLLQIASKPDNVPILMLIVIFAVFTGLALRQAFQNDRLIRAGRKKEILKAMQD